MAFPERTFGPSLDGSSVYLDTTESQWLDATSGEGTLHVPGGDFVLEAQYSRLGPDLFLSGEEHSVFVKGYFTHEQAPDLYTTDGSAVVRGSVATRLAGPATPGQFAQADSVPGIQPIGIVDNAEGRAFLSRLDGTNVLAEEGTPVFLGDIVETEGGSSVGITFVDDSTFALGESGRMIIDELVFDAAAGTGQSAFNVLKGVFSFVSGDIAETGDDAMVVNTPVLSIGVRGTTVAGRAAAEGSDNTVTLLPDASGTVGAIAVSNAGGVQVMSQPFATTTVTSQFQAPAVPVQLPAASVQDLYGDISTVLPPEPATRQEDSSSDSDGAATRQQATEGQEGPVEEAGEEGEEDAEGEGGPEGEEFLEGEGEGLEEGEGAELEERLEGEGPEGEPGERAARDGTAGEFAEGREGEFAEGPEGEFAEGPEGEFVEGPEGEFVEGPEGEFVEGPEGEFAEGPEREPGERAARDGTAGEFAEGPEGEFGPEGGTSTYDGEPEGVASVAEEAFGEARAEGLSSEEAAFRASDAVEEAFSEGPVEPDGPGYDPGPEFSSDISGSSLRPSFSSVGPFSSYESAGMGGMDPGFLVPTSVHGVADMLGGPAGDVDFGGVLSAFGDVGFGGSFGPMGPGMRGADPFGDPFGDVFGDPFLDLFNIAAGLFDPTQQFEDPFSERRDDLVFFDDRGPSGSIDIPALTGISINLSGSSSGTRVEGTDRNDTIVGSSGNDVVMPRAGSDFVDGGPGSDTIGYSTNQDVGMTVDLGAGTASGPGYFSTFINFENATGSRFSDALRGDSGSNVLRGLTGDDTLEGGAGTDTLVGGAGNDTYVVGDTFDTITELADPVFEERTVSNPSSIGDLTATVTDSESGSANNTIGTAQSVAITDFDITNGNDVASVSLPRAVITGSINTNNDTDFYSIPVLAGDRLVFDIDFGQAGGLDPVDTQLHIFNGFSELVSSNDDSSTSYGGTGSTHAYDSYLSYTASNDENITVSVSSFNNDSSSGGAFTGAGYSSGDYALNVSLDRSVSEGTADWVLSSVPYTLGSNIENLTLTGTADLNGTGNSAANTINGNDGSNL